MPNGSVPKRCSRARFAALLSYAQRRLSNGVRRLRRQVASVSSLVERKDGTQEPVTRETLIAGNEAALRALTAGVIVLAVALVVLRCRVERRSLYYRILSAGGVRP